MTTPQLESLLAIGLLPIEMLLGAGPTSDRGGENPSPTGPEGERVGEKDEPIESNKQLDPIPGPGAPMVPDHQRIDSNPIDPRVF